MSLGTVLVSLDGTWLEGLKPSLESLGPVELLGPSDVTLTAGVTSGVTVTAEERKTGAGVEEEDFFL